MLCKSFKVSRADVLLIESEGGSGTPLALSNSLYYSHTVCITVTNSVLHTVERGCRMTRLHLRLTIDSCKVLNIQWIIHRYTSGLRNIIGKSREIDAKWRDMSKQFLLSNCKLFSAENLPVWPIFSHSTALCLRPQLRSHRTCQADCNSWPLYPPTCRSPLIGFSIGPFILIYLTIAMHYWQKEM